MNPGTATDLIALHELLARLPGARPFTTLEARECGVAAKDLRRLVAGGLIGHPMRGVYLSASLPDSLSVRVECLRMVVPAECVVTDRTAAWLWGARTALAPNDHLTVPRVAVFSPPGHRLRNHLVASGERRFREDDVAEVGGLQVTTPLRTAADLGRLLHRDQALAAMDAVAGLRAFSVEELEWTVHRYKGYRGVLQLRTLVSLVDPASQSPGESVLRLRWLDAGLPRPTCQLRVPAPSGSSWFLDMGLPGLKLAAEYDGEEHHTDPADVAHDDRRRDWLRETGWTVVVARREGVFGARADVEHRLRAAWQTARTR